MHGTFEDEVHLLSSSSSEYDNSDHSLDGSASDDDADDVDVAVSSHESWYTDQNSPPSTIFDGKIEPLRGSYDLAAANKSIQMGIRVLVGYK